MRFGDDFQDVQPCTDSDFECPGWKEYTYTRPGHGRGYFWQREQDGIRLFYRPAGDYYRDNETFKPIKPPKDPIDCGIHTLWGSDPFGLYAPKAFDIAGASREAAKKEACPHQMRVYDRHGNLLLFFEEWKGKPLSYYVNSSEEFDTRHMAPWLASILPPPEGAKKVANAGL